MRTVAGVFLMASATTGYMALSMRYPEILYKSEASAWIASAVLFCVSVVVAALVDRKDPS